MQLNCTSDLTPRLRLTAGLRIIVDGKGVLTAMMDDDNAKKKFQVRVENLARFCPNKEGHILCLLERVGDGPIIIYMIYLAAHLQK